MDVTLGSAHAEGINTVASGTASHAQGVETSAVGIYSFAGGRATYAEGYNSKADGAQTSAIGNYSIAEGLRCRAGEDRSYVWSSFAGEIKTDNGAGTFNVHPDAGISGFFIGENDFVKCVYDAVQVSAEALKELLGITGSDSQLQEINNLADEIMN